MKTTGLIQIIPTIDTHFSSILVLPVLDSVKNISPVCPLKTIFFYKIVFVCLSKLGLYFYQT